MASDQFQTIVSKVRDKFSEADLSQFPQKYAVQINLTGKISGVFYVEVLNGKLSVEPYEYIDKDVAININKTTLDKILDGKLRIERAFTDKKLTVDGDFDKAAMLKNFL